MKVDSNARISKPSNVRPHTSRLLSAVGGRRGWAGKATQASPERRLEFENVLSRNLPGFRRVAMRWLRNPEDAEDAVQDAMLSAFKHIARFEGRAQMSTWLMAILINAVRMQLRRRPRHTHLPLDQPTREGQRTISDLIADQRPTPEQTLEKCELLELITKLTRSLPPSQRAAMELRQRDDGLSVKDAAEALGVPVGTLKAQLARGRVTLRQQLRWSNSTTNGKDSDHYDIAGKEQAK